MIEVYAATNPLDGAGDLEDLDMATRSRRPVALGEGRHVRIDVTKIVRAHLAESLVNYGLVIGTISGMREGDFTIVANRFPDAAVGKLNIYMSNHAN